MTLSFAELELSLQLTQTFEPSDQVLRRCRDLREALGMRFEILIGLSELLRFKFRRFEGKLHLS
jgi:hypothetical protein